MALGLKRGTKLILEIEPTDYGLRLIVELGVGKTVRKRQGNPVHARTEEAILVAIETWAQQGLARIGLEKTSK